MDVSDLLKVISGLWHCLFLQLAVQVLGCCPIVACSTFTGVLACLTVLYTLGTKNNFAGGGQISSVILIVSG